MAQRIYLGIVGGIFIASGLFAFIDPHAMGEWLGIAAIDVTGETGIAANQGIAIVFELFVVGFAGFFLRRTLAEVQGLRDGGY